MKKEMKGTDRRNARERKRVKGINEMLTLLKNKLPEEWTSRKMSKLEILRKSTLYIKRLQQMTQNEHDKYVSLDESEGCEDEDRVQMDSGKDWNLDKQLSRLLHRPEVKPVLPLTMFSVLKWNLWRIIISALIFPTMICQF